MFCCWLRNKLTTTPGFGVRSPRGGVGLVYQQMFWAVDLCFGPLTHVLGQMSANRCFAVCVAGVATRVCVTCVATRVCDICVASRVCVTCVATRVCDICVATRVCVAGVATRVCDICVAIKSMCCRCSNQEYVIYV